MDDQGKKKRWAKSLDEAGLLDSVDDYWEMNSDPDSEAVIRVNGAEPVLSEGTEPEKDNWSIESESENGISRDNAKSKDDLSEYRMAMQERLEISDYSGALEIAELLLESDENDEIARDYRDKCQKALLEMYESQIGSLDRIPTMAIDIQDVIWRSLDSSSGFILSHVDGRIAFSDIIDISGLTKFETCRILYQLLQEGIIK